MTWFPTASLNGIGTKLSCNNNIVMASAGWVPHEQSFLQPFGRTVTSRSEIEDGPWIGRKTIFCYTPTDRGVYHFVKDTNTV